MKYFFDYLLEIESRCIYGEINENVDLTIMVPTYMRNDLLSKTVKSILNQVPPKHLLYQVIIVSNDPSFKVQDLSVSLPPELFCVYVNNENLGMVGNMNRCVKLSKGKYVAFLQDDDLLLPNYLIEIENIIDRGVFNKIGCVVPNSYSFYDRNNEGIFGRKAIMRTKVKSLISWIFRSCWRIPEFQKVDELVCAEAAYNAFGSGPSLGITFRRDALISSCGFNPNIPYAFDLVFFHRFSNDFGTFLYNKYLSIIRMSYSSSNSAKVQEDFLKNADLYLLAKTKAKSNLLKKYENEYIRFSVENKCSEVAENHRYDYKKNNYKYFKYRIIRMYKLMTSGIYRRKLLPFNLYDLL